MARDLTTYSFNEHAGEEVGRETTGNGVDITYAGLFTLKEGGISVSGSESFIAQYQSDRAVLLGTPDGEELYSIVQGEGKFNGITTFINEASGSIWYNPFTWSPSKMDDLKAGITSPILKTIPPNSQYFDNKIKLAYSQHNDIMYDGALTKSYITLAHELQHAADILRGRGIGLSRMDGERRAVARENSIRKFLKISGKRTHYHGEKL